MSQIVATVVFIKDSSTVKVKIETLIEHKLYKKRVKRVTNLLCHNGDSVAIAVGDKVFIKQCKPISKKKSFAIVAKAS
jgi:small subunit ribosomal protein S17